MFLGLSIYLSVGAIVAAWLVTGSYKEWRNGDYDNDDDIPRWAYYWLFDRNGGLILLSTAVTLGWPIFLYDLVSSALFGSD